MPNSKDQQTPVICFYLKVSIVLQQCKESSLTASTVPENLLQTMLD